MTERKHNHVTNMLKQFAVLTVSLMTTQWVLAALPAQVGDQPLPSLAPLVREVSPAVVNIATRGTVTAPSNPFMDDPFFQRFFGVPPQQRERQVSSAGSGVIVDATNGYILTNHHVIENADQIEIVLIDNRSLEAKVVGSDPLPRSEITKKLWDYIKANKLQTKTENGKPEGGGKFIVADAKLVAIFKNTNSKSKSGKVTDLRKLKEGETINMMQMAAVVAANIEA